MQCQYCGAVQGVPDLAARERALWERQRHEAAQQQRQYEAQHRAEEARRQAIRDREERAERKSSVRWGRLTMIFSMLLAPAIISVTVFDLPARLGFGDDGSERLGVIVQQFASRGCKMIAPQVSTYTKSTETRLVQVEAGSCLRVMAAGGGDHDSLTLKVFDLDGRAVAKSVESRDPQVKHCATGAASLRYEVVPGVLDKGRLSHVALACPTEPPAAADGAAAEDEPVKSKPGKKPRK